MEWISRFLRILIIVGLVSSPTLGQETKYRTFTNKEGTKIEASVVDVKGAEVIIVMKNGKRFKFPIVSLSEADQEYVKSWKKPIGKLEFEVKCTKKPAAQAKSDNTLPALSGRTRSKGY